MSAVGSGATFAAFSDLAADWQSRCGDGPEFQGWLRSEVAPRALVALDELARVHAGAVREAAAAWLEDNGAGMPELAVVSDGVRGDAAFWADIASPAELEAYVGAGLRVMGRTAFAAEARKRLLVLIWQSMTETDRRAFLARVDPKGTFRARAV